ncbi:hypothetical protein KGY71_02005 [Candidatus Bipolaricaulota bacterium]|nr:hypothetical protein [Candidatus Bipolaricaulota bacterium]
MRYSNLAGKSAHQLPNSPYEKGQLYLLQSGGIQEFDGRPVLLPLGKRAWDKMVELFRTEFRSLEVQEIDFPLYLPGDDETGNKKDFTEEYFRELFANLSKRHISSYRDLPLRVAKDNIVTKEESPLFNRQGEPVYVIYSMDKNEEERESFSSRLYEGIMRVLSTLGLGEITHTYSPKDSGYSSSQRRILGETNRGGKQYLSCTNCDYVAPKKLAESIFAPYPQDEEPRPLKSIHGPDLISVEDLAKFADIDVLKTTKTIVFETSETDRIITVMVRGDFDVSEEKLKRVIGEEDFYLASSYTIREVFGTEVGYTGVVDLPQKVELIADRTTKGRINFECGANKTDHHLLNVNFGRDLPEPDEFYDVREAVEGETCAQCEEGQLELINTTKIASFTPIEKEKDLAATYAGKDGKERPAPVRGFKFFPPSVFALVLQENHDEDGLIWPPEISPFEVHLISLGNNNEITQPANEIYQKLQKSGFEVLWDDRDKKPGVKFNDADLLGIPVRLVLGRNFLDKNQIEWEERKSGKKKFIKPNELIDNLREFMCQV